MGVSDSLTIDGMDEMLERLDTALKDFPERKMQVLGALGSRVEDEVRTQVVAQGVNDASGHVRSWQRYEVGSKGGYVAVRPVDEVVNKKYGTTARQVTRYLEKGHGLPKGHGPSGLDDRRSGLNDRTGLGYVSGFYFYSWTHSRFGMDLKRHAKKAGEKLLRETAERMAGK